MKALFLMLGLCVAVTDQAKAQTASTPDRNDYAFCSERPAEPEYLENMDMRDAHRRILVQRMYTEAALKAVVETGDCACETRFPPWDAAIERYLNIHAGTSERWEILELTSSYRKTANDYRKIARPICVEEGNW